MSRAAEKRLFFHLPTALRRAFTLMEMLLALSIMTVISTAACTLVVGVLNGDRFLRATNTAQFEVELAMRRIINNLREAQTGSIVVGSSTLSTVTQSDIADGYLAGATVSYALQSDPSNAGQQILVETDQRYGTNTLVHHVTTFTVSAVSGVSNLYQIDLVVGSDMQEERHFKVLARN